MGVLDHIRVVFDHLLILLFAGWMLLMLMPCRRRRRRQESGIRNGGPCIRAVRGPNQVLYLSFPSD